MIYVDNAASEPTSYRARRAALRHLLYTEQSFANPSALHEMGLQAAAEIAEARNTISRLLNAPPATRLVFTSGGTEANNQAVLTAARWCRENARLHVVASAIEHPSVLRPLERLQKQGYDVTLVQPDRQGRITPAALSNAIRRGTGFVSIMQANNELGTVNDIAALCEIAHKNGALFHTDAVQTTGHIPVDMQALGVDMLTLSAHKFGGMKGAGVLLSRIEPQPLLLGGHQQQGMRAGTENLPAAAAMAAALQESVDLMKKRYAYTKSLRGLLEYLLCRDIEGAEPNIDYLVTEALPGILNIRFEGVSTAALLPLLSANGVYASAGSACSAGEDEPSHVLSAIGLDHEQIRSSIRFSPSYYNMEREIWEVARITAECVAILRRH